MGRRQCELDGCTKGIQAGGTQHCKARTAGTSAAKKRAVPRQLLLAARSIVSHMAEADGAKRRASPSQLEATRVPARRMVAAGAAKRRAASSQLEATRVPASHMAGANAAKRRAASSQWRLCGARRGQTVPRGGLRQGCSRRHGCLLRWNGMLMTTCSHH
jgi:hypothetical protein